MKYLKSVALMLFVVYFLSACGGGGGGGGTTPQGDTTYNINGAVQKGPFIKGTKITTQELDKNLNPTGKTYSTETTDAFGKFSLQSQLSSPYIEITADGYYFDEVQGKLSSSTLTLRAITDLSTSDIVNINILTTLEKNRLINLARGGKTFADAKIQAEGEILNIFGIYENFSYFEQMDISKEGNDNAILLAASVVLENIAVSKGGADNTVVAQLSQPVQLQS